MNRDQALKKLQQEELGILLVLADFCRQHDIEWFLYAGSALGALRHGGFIPWDDDIDIGVMREDYERLCALLAENPPAGYRLELPCKTDNYAPLFAKLCKEGTAFENDETIDSGFDQGIFVDIFPFDYLAADEAARDSQWRNALLWQKISYIYHSTKINVPHKGALRAVELAGCFVLHYVFRLFLNPRIILEKFNRSILRDDEERSNICMAFSSVLGTRFPVEVILPPTTANFEGHQLNVPAQPEKYLELTFGDWRKLPAPENRHTHLAKRLKFSDGTSWEAE